jgi:hypothetical protein
MSNLQMSNGSRRAAKSLASRFFWLAPVALAACQVAMADSPRDPGARHRHGATHPSSQTMQSAARAAESGRDAWHGRRYANLIEDFTRWFYSVPLDVSSANPAETGVNCGMNQEGPVWFVMGPALPTFTVTCNVPAGKAIFMPAFSYANSFPCPANTGFNQLVPGQSLETLLRSGSAEFMDAFSFLSMTLDGKPVKLRRAATGVFSFTGAKDWANFDPCVTGSPQLAQSDGQFAFIDPPSVGRHTINVKAVHPAFPGPIDGTWIINVVR